MPADDSFTALPSTAARVLAFVAIIAAGAFGGLTGYGVVAVQCKGNCALSEGLALFAGAVAAAGGVAIVAVLVLRAMGEWRRLHAG